MNSSGKVILNTGFLYANMLVTLAVQLVAVRLVLVALGAADYGIYTLVAGIVSMFSFMNVSMAAATQRYLSYAIGQGDRQQLKETFYHSVLLHIIIGAVVLVLLESGGTYYVNHLLNAPADRIGAAGTLLHCIAFSTLVNILSVPYEADINANEDMGVIALLNMFDSLMKLGIAIYIGHCHSDKLIVYGLLTALSISATLLAKVVYCKFHYQESRIRFHRVRQWRDVWGVASFAMWNLIGSGCSILRYQGTAVVLNSVFGIVINAAYGVAQQVNGLLVFFANTIVRAIRPQIVKSEGGGDRARMLRLSHTTCRITALMVALLAVPLFVEMEFVLRLWLRGSVPPDSVMFCRFFLLIVFINQLTIGLQIAIESTGNIKALQLIVGAMHFLPLPAGWLCLKTGMPAGSVMACIVVEELVCIVLRTLIARRQTGLDGWGFLTGTVIPCACVALAAWVVAGFLHGLLQPYAWASLIVVSVVSTLVIVWAAYKFLLTPNELSAIRMFMSQVAAKVRRSGRH